MDYLFSHENYTELLRIIIQTGTYRDYADITPSTTNFILLRHDVEFSPKRAVELGEIEAQHKISSSFFFQLTNNAYNTLSSVNVDRMKHLISLGHHVGLHLHCGSCPNPEQVVPRIRYECEILSDAIGAPVDRFSFHRPSRVLLSDPYRVPGLINVYDPLYFTHCDSLENVDFFKNIKYIADSRNEWSYIAPWKYPCKEIFAAFPKLHLLCHPYSWSCGGQHTLENLRQVLEENRLELIQTMNQETTYIQKYLNDLI